MVWHLAWYPASIFMLLLFPSSTNPGGDATQNHPEPLSVEPSTGARWINGSPGGSPRPQTARGDRDG